jgi:hypothetical protein
VVEQVQTVSLKDRLACGLHSTAHRPWLYEIRHGLPVNRGIVPT